MQGLDIGVVEEKAAQAKEAAEKVKRDSAQFNQIKEVFKTFDSDGNGFLDQSEARLRADSRARSAHTRNGFAVAFYESQNS